MTLVTQTQTALRALGSTPAAVGAALRAQGYRGAHDPSDDPVARYLRDVLGTDVVVRSDHVEIHRRSRTPDTWRWTCPLTPAVGAFVELFDDDQYPEFLEGPDVSRLTTHS